MVEVGGVRAMHHLQPILLTVLLSLRSATCTTAQFASLQVYSGPDSIDSGEGPVYETCMRFAPELNNLTELPTQARRHQLSRVKQVNYHDACVTYSMGDHRNALRDRILLIHLDKTEVDCSMLKMAHNAQAQGAAGIFAFFFSGFWRDLDFPETAKPDPEMSLPTDTLVGNVYRYGFDGTIHSLSEQYPSGEFVVTRSSQREPPFLGLAILGLIAITAMTIGTFWGGHMFTDTRFNMVKTQMKWWHWALFFGAMCTVLVLLASFPGFMGYIVKFIFVINAVAGFHTTFEPVVNWSYRILPMPLVNLPTELKFTLFELKELRQALLFLLALALPSLWLFLSSAGLAPYDWILVDFLGICNCIFMHRFMRVESLKPLAIILSIIFFYDIFFVFITPLIFGGRSIMEQAALGLGVAFLTDEEPSPDVGEASTATIMEEYKAKLPILFVVYGPRGYMPQFCIESRVILGFGDVFLPGLLGAFCHAWDLFKGLKCKPYWTVFMTGYCLSLPVTFTVMLLSEMGQPALLYIVPLTLLPVGLTGLARGEFRQLWQGIPADRADNGSEQGQAEQTPMQPLNKNNDSNQNNKSENKPKEDEK